MERGTYEKTETSCDGDKFGYDAVVVGSGYGGSVAACRMSMAGINVCLMEKGRKWEAQDFPTNSFSIMSAFRVESKNRGFSFGPKDALFQVYEQDDSLAAVVCGLGGGSLINAGVMVSTPMRARRNKKWPREWENDWEACEASASTMLKAQSLPVEFPNAKLMRQTVMEEIEEYSPGHIKLSINFDSTGNQTNSTGSQQANSCLACGNCLSGCPYNAKNSTDKNYLASAIRCGCTIKTECEVQYVVRNFPEGGEDGNEINISPRRRWRVYVNDIDYILCDFVIISAGVLGTTTMLFQSARRGLHVSERLGCGFSSNGNNVSYVAASSAPLNSYGLDKSELSDIPFQNRPGPSISSSYTSSLGFTIQSAMLPTSYPYLLFKGIITYGWPNSFWFLHGAVDKLNHMLGLKASQAMVLNVMGYDDCDGKITLEKGEEKISFTAAYDSLLPRKIQALQKLTKRLGGILFLSRNRSTSVHLLGGCNTASDPSQGVCNSNGQVFNSDHPSTVHPGLYVCDASLIPCSVGINPCLTIATVAEHVSRYLVQDVLKYKSSTNSVHILEPQLTVNAHLQPEQRSTVMIKETMHGFVGGMPLTVYFTMKMDLGEQDRRLTEYSPCLRGKVGGYVIFKSMEQDRLYIVDGKVNMCEVDTRTPYTQFMHYHLILASASGSRYVLEGKKVMNPYLLFSYAWWESRTLQVTFKSVGKQSKEEQKINLLGELSVSSIDLLRSLIGLRGNAKGRFIYRLLKSLWQTYILQTPRGSLHELSSPDLKEKLYPSSIHHEIKTGDGVIITCTQWKCNLDSRKTDGQIQYPVLLINGYLGESYWLPTEPNDLIRTLLERGHDTWLLQSRLHPSHPSNKFTVEDIGKYDIPAALKLIHNFHGKYTQVHVVAHCVGGLAIHIALMGGYVPATEIASLSCTSSSMFYKLTTSSMVKMALPIIPISMNILGKDSILPISQDLKSSMSQRLLKSIARLIPRYERCTYDECEVSSGIFGNAFWHENLSPSLHHWLSKINIQRLPMSAFPHLRKICNTGFIVDPEGKNTYMIHPERMAVNTLYISGGRTLLVTPETSFLANKYMKIHQPEYRHTRVVVDGFGHSDLLIGEESEQKVFPHIISHITITEQGSNGVLDAGKRIHDRETLLWSWDNDPRESGKGGLLSWIPIFILLAIFLFVMFMMYALV